MKSNHTCITFTSVVPRKLLLDETLQGNEQKITLILKEVSVSSNWFLNLFINIQQKGEKTRDY